MDRLLRWYAAHVGRRGTALLLFAALDLAYAFSLFWPAPDLLRSQTTLFLTGIADLWLFGLLWTGSALMALGSAFLDRDRFGFAAVALVKAMWSALMVWAAVEGVSRAYVSAAIWMGYCGFVVLISTWAERDGR